MRPPAAVIDNSVTVAWFLDAETTDFTDDWLDAAADTTLWVPALWSLEFVNVLLAAQRRKRITTAARREFLRQADELRLAVDRDPVPMDRIDEIADRHGLTAYDAAYLELAMRRGVPLVTLDGDLVRAARAARHPCITDGGR